MPEYTSWEESRGRIEDRFEHIEKILDAILRNMGKLLWVGIGALVTLLVHALVSFIQMGGLK